MAAGFLVRRVFLFSQSFTAVSVGLKALILSTQSEKAHYATTTTAPFTATNTENEVKNGKRKGQWLTLPPFTSTVDGAALGKELAHRKVKVSSGGATSSTMTALKWVLRCCPELPRSLVQKLFRLRQVRRESFCTTKSNLVGGTQEYQLKRLAAKDSLNLGDQIFLPITVQKSPSVKAESHCSEQEIKFLHSLQLYKDEAIVAVNKPPGLPVQGGIRIHRSLDELAAAYMRYDLTEPPRLVHRLDRDSSGILVMGRTQLSATILHSIFREKTFGASNNDLNSKKRMLQRRYWALVLGCPRRPEGLISKPLLKVVLDNGKSERITVVDNVQAVSSLHAITEYRVIESFKGHSKFFSH